MTKTLDELYKAIERSKSTDAYKTNEPEANDNNCKAPCTPNCTSSNKLDIIVWSNLQKNC